MILLLLLAVRPAKGAETRSREEVRAEYLLSLHENGGKTYADRPFVQNPYSAGELSEDALGAALSSANFIRWLAGLEELELQDSLNELAQHGAVLMAANGALSHAPEKPEDMDEDFFKMGADAAASCNLAMYNWFEEGILSDAAGQFVRDDGERNRSVLGHRRWMLYPKLRYTGFGLAQDADGRSYAAMYVMDESNPDAEYDLVCWPCGGAFPAEFLTADTCWSITPNPAIYDLQASWPRITLTEEATGAQFLFENMTESADGEQFFTLGGGRYGEGPTYIFRPGLSEYDRLMYGYQQNQVWTVRLEGMLLLDGTEQEPVEYTVEMISLTPIDPAAVEIMPREAALKAGESVKLQAQVIPDWSDDLTVSWRSEDEAVVTVDADGMVRALSPGSAWVVAAAVNGRYDRIRVTVSE